MSRRFFLDQEFREGEILNPDPKEFSEELKHLSRVLRRTTGDRILLTNGRRVEAEAEIINLHKSGISFRVHKVRKLPAPAVAIELAQGILKGPRMDWLVEKLTELEVSSLLPVVSEFVVSADAAEDTKKRLDRWQRISLSAVKQSGAGAALTISPSQELAELGLGDGSRGILLSPNTNAPPLHEVLKICKDPTIKKIVLAVGPEGGFSAEEEESLAKKGFLPARLGNSILRGETAALVTCALARDWIDFWRG